MKTYPLILHFSPAFPDDRLAGECVVLYPHTPNGDNATYTFGRGKHCDLHLKIQKNNDGSTLDERIKANCGIWISKYHCTFFWRSGRWFILDGGYYAPDEIDSTVMYHPTLNGTFLNGDRLDSENPEPLDINDQISLTAAPRNRIIVGKSVYDTLIPDAWEGASWPFSDSSPKKTSPNLPPDTQAQLERHAVEANSSPIDVASKIINWVATPTQSGWDFSLKSLLLILGTTVALMLL